MNVNDLSKFRIIPSKKDLVEVEFSGYPKFLDKNRFTTHAI